MDASKEGRVHEVSIIHFYNKKLKVTNSKKVEERYNFSVKKASLFFFSHTFSHYSYPQILPSKTNSQ